MRRFKRLVEGYGDTMIFDHWCAVAGDMPANPLGLKEFPVARPLPVHMRGESRVQKEQVGTALAHSSLQTSS